jgi:predicted TIM-barrel fold metal-dependent hydrolase
MRELAKYGYHRGEREPGAACLMRAADRAARSEKIRHDLSYLCDDGSRQSAARMPGATACPRLRQSDPVVMLALAMVTRPNPSAARIRAKLDHPIIDADGHCLEYLPVVRDYLREVGGARADKGFWGVLETSRAMALATPAERRGWGLMRPPWWAFPAENTLDRATALLPRLLHERLEEIGIDFAVVYPTYGLIVFNIADAEIRRASARAFNRYFADAYRDFADRLRPVAVIPMHTPEEALDELDFACGSLGMKAVLLAGFVHRDVSAAGATPRPLQWMDTFGADSLFDYEPVWRRCAELGVSPTFHSSGMGWGSRNSPSSYVFNHLGNFAAGGEVTCRALFLEGVARRHPSLRFAFLEGGVAWAATLYSDLIGHFEKRNRRAVARYDHERVDRVELVRLLREYGDERIRERIDDLEQSLWPFSEPGSAESPRDEFERSGVQSAADIAEVFGRSFFFGCEADDPQNAAAFDRRRNPRGLVLNAIFSSDIGHWDVPDNREVLTEAYELVEHGHLSIEDFRAFTFANPVALHTATNPRFFDGTSVGNAVAATVKR